MISSGIRPSFTSSACRVPAWWASARRATHWVPGLAGPDAQADGQVRFPGPGRAEEHHVLFAGDEGESAQMRDLVAFHRSLVVVVELLQTLAGREAGGPDPAFTTVGLAGGDLSLQAGGQELLVGPGLGSGPFGETLDRVRQRGSFQ